MKRNALGMGLFFSVVVLVAASLMCSPAAAPWPFLRPAARRI